MPHDGSVRAKCLGLACRWRHRRSGPNALHFGTSSSPEIIRLVVMMYIRIPRSLHSLQDLLHERGTDICHERYSSGGTGLVRFWRRDIR